MKNKIKRDYLKRLNFSIGEPSSLVTKALKNNRILPLSFRVDVLPLINPVTKIRNVCMFTGRSRGILKSHSLSHMQFRILADMGKLPGWRRASW